MMLITELKSHTQAQEVIEMLRKNNRLPNLNTHELMQDHFLLLKDGVVAGVTGIGRGNWFSTEIFHTCVFPEFRKQGVATALNEFAIYYARDVLQKKVLTCTARDENEASKRLINKMGFNLACSFENNGNQINYYVRGLI